MKLFDSCKKTFSSLSTILRFQKLAAHHCPKYLFVLIALSLTKAMTPFILVIFPKYILDEVFGKARILTLLYYVLAMAALMLFSNIVSTILTNDLHYISLTLKADLRRSLAYQTTNIKYEFLEQPSVMNMKQNATKFLEEDIDKTIYIIPDFIAAIVAVCGYFYIISQLHVLIIVLIFLVVLFTANSQKKVEKYAFEYRHKMADLERKISYYITTTPDIKYGKDIRNYNLQNWLYQKYGEQLAETGNGYKKVFNKRKQNGIQVTFANTIQTIGVYIWLVYSVINNGLSIGSFTMYLSAITNTSNSIISIFKNWVILISVKQGMDDYFSFMATDLEEKGGKDFDISEPIIEFRNVWFRYPNQAEYTLKDLSCQISFGTKTAIVGENGAGKTTFVKLLTRLYEPTRGGIYLNGVNIKEIDIVKYRQLLSVVFQDYSIFSFSIKENIALTNSDDTSSDEHVLSALSAVGLRPKIESLPAKQDTFIGTVFSPDGIQLSGGEQQKVAIARAVYRDSPILIFDEPTSSLDPRAEYEIYKSFFSMAQNRTTICITHRLGSACICDDIIVLSHGEIVEHGTHNQLIDGGGLYSELFNMQKNYYDTSEVK